MAIVQRVQVIALTAQAHDAVHDNSKPFSTYLAKEGLSKVLKKTKLRLKEKHTIIARVCFPLLPIGKSLRQALTIT
jgi:hypothetical protein